jgi:hypothetical protein
MAIEEENETQKSDISNGEGKKMKHGKNVIYCFCDTIKMGNYRCNKEFFFCTTFLLLG